MLSQVYATFRGLSLLFAVSCTMYAFQDTASAAGGPLWSTGYEQALQISQSTGQPVLLHFYGDNCLPCRRMDREVLNSSDVQKSLGNDVVAVKVHLDQRRDLVDKYKVQTIPTDIFVDSEGRVLSLSIGYVGSGDYLAKANKVSSRYKESLALREQRKNNGGDLPEQPLPRLVAKIPVEAQGVSQSSPIGLDGYCPVSLWTQREWVSGEKVYSSEYQGFTYQFLSNEAKTQFEENPSRYVPQLLGCDAVVLWETGRSVIGSTDHGAFYQNELYLFSNDENRRLFKLDPTHYTRERQAINIDDVEMSVIR